MCVCVEKAGTSMAYLQTLKVYVATSCIENHRDI